MSGRMGVVVAVVLTASLASAAHTPGERCALAKLKAATRKTGAKLLCAERALVKGTAATSS